MVTMEEYQQQQMNLQSELEQLQKLDGQQRVDNNAYAYANDTADNLIKWQLEVNDIIDTLYHMLRGDRILIENGERVWKDLEDKDDMPVSEKGVADILRETYVYINKNLLLSYYDQKQIDMRMYSFGDYFADLIMDNYEMLGMNTEEKQERYSLIVLATVNAVNSAYNRALGGKERDSLTKKTMVHQSLNPQVMSQQKKGGVSLNPLKWFGA